MTTIEPVTAFCSSDEDDDRNTLLYLPISPEIEEPEEGWGLEGAPNEDSVSKRMSDGKENASPKKKRAKTCDIALENAPTDGNVLLICDFHIIYFNFLLCSCLIYINFFVFIEVHPLTTSRPKDKQNTGNKKGRNNAKGDSKKDRKKH